MTQQIYNENFVIDYVEIYTPSAKIMAYWHVNALKFTLEAYNDFETGNIGISSYLLKSKDINIVLTSAYPSANSKQNDEISEFIAKNYCGIKRVALQTSNVVKAFEEAIVKGAFPIKFPTKLIDDEGVVEEAAIKLYDQSEILFINRSGYSGEFKPGFRKSANDALIKPPLLSSIDHIAGEVRINESIYWSDYLGKILDLKMVQNFEQSDENRTGMTLKVNQSDNKKLTFVIAEPESYLKKSKVQSNIDNYGPGFHHLAFMTDDILQTLTDFKSSGVEFVKIPSAYYELLRAKPEFDGFDIDSLQQSGILIDKEGDSYLLQKFLKPLNDRPFFFYEIVQRVNGYLGFALNNINVLKRAEEIEIIK
jgi:4-hydroxyphenylpyruvate dioxygenase